MQSINRTIANIPLKHAAWILIIFPSLFLVFHLLIILGYLPSNIVWGGRLTEKTLVPFELFAIALNLLLVLVGAVSAERIYHPMLIKLAQSIQWFLFYFVVVNTLFALFSTTLFEVLLTPITALYAICLYRIAKFPD